MSILECQNALGMENGLISDVQLSASSRWNDLEGADRSRLHLTELWDPHLRSGAWIAKTNDINQWLQIDVLGVNRKYVRVTRVATQGRDSTAYSGVQCVKTYKLQYSNDGVNFQYYKESGQTTAKVILYVGDGIKLQAICSEESLKVLNDIFIPCNLRASMLLN